MLKFIRHVAHFGAKSPMFSPILKSCWNSAEIVQKMLGNLFQNVDHSNVASVNDCAALRAALRAAIRAASGDLRTAQFGLRLHRQPGLAPTSFASKSTKSSGLQHQTARSWPYQKITQRFAQKSCKVLR